MIGRTRWDSLARLVGGAVVIALTTPSAWAHACDSRNTNPIPILPAKIPDCELQVQPALKLSGWDTKGWAFCCTGDHPYYWGLFQGFSPSFAFNNTCFSVAENAATDDADAGKFDATFTNWCLKSETVTMTLACTDKAVDPAP